MTEPEERHWLGVIAVKAISYMLWQSRHDSGWDGKALLSHLSDAALADAISLHEGVVYRDGKDRYDADAGVVDMIRAEIARRAQSVGKPDPNYQPFAS